MVPRPRARLWARLHRARAQHFVRRSNVTHGDRGFPRARWAQPGASGPLASYRDVGRGDRPRLKDQEARSDRMVDRSLSPPTVTEGEKPLRREVAMAYRTVLEAGRSHHAALEPDSKGCCVAVRAPGLEHGTVGHSY